MLHGAEPLVLFCLLLITAANYCFYHYFLVIAGLTSREEVELVLSLGDPQRLACPQYRHPSIFCVTARGLLLRAGPPYRMGSLHRCWFARPRCLAPPQPGSARGPGVPAGHLLCLLQTRLGALTQRPAQYIYLFLNKQVKHRENLCGHFPTYSLEVCLCGSIFMKHRIIGHRAKEVCSRHSASVRDAAIPMWVPIRHVFVRL